jgi:hypothetical protein
VIPIYLARGMKAQGRPSDSGRFLTAIHLQNQVMMRPGAIAIVTATTSLIMPKPSRTRMMRGHVLLSGSDRLRLTITQYNGSTRTIFSIGLPASVSHAPSPISTIPSHIPSLIMVQEPPQALVRRVNWIQTCRPTAATHHPETSC